ncbi:hypothetical protein KSF_013420 [Reticulibacter mediterranei]|uniref:Uncharacterized protein n=1 Tax=Reticulibacter mediterranei TaxID=2778369 RepID=A0A8J3IHA6_9CHLR|nr:hypothetical protein [Reticulibacter mediterranei]GHO91294.1 hypothetical protein KSF_013420 [Reticulibacter mediterranei]
MPTGLIFSELTLFGLVLWLGLYLIGRDLKNCRLWSIGGGQVAYAVGISCGILSKYNVASSSMLTITHLILLLLSFFLLFPTGLFQLFSLNDTFTTTSSNPAFRKLRLCYLSSLILLPPGIGLSLLPLYEPLHAGILFCVGLDLLVFGLVTAALDAFNRGEALLPDLFRSFDYSLLIALLFGGQVLLFMFLGLGITFLSLLLLMMILTTAITTQVFSDQLVTWLDTIAFSSFPHLQQVRAELRSRASKMPRVDPGIDLATIDESEFIRFTRQALRNFGDLGRLSTNPLANLPTIEVRLQQQNRQIDMLERAAELKAVLTECITRLKPRGDDDFGTSDEWRYYNALYFLYVVGLKPYSQRTQHIPSDPVTRNALEWFRVHVPERTLYNWQNAATRLIVQDLRNNSQQLNGTTKERVAPATATSRKGAKVKS